MIGCIIQARVNSTRVPKKILQNLDKEDSVLEYVINQVKNSKKINQIIIATTSLKDDDIVIDISEKNGCNVFRGSEDDVLDRYFQCARKFELDVIVRVTSDCPLIDPQIIDQVIEEFESGNFDYVTNTFPRTFPKGLDVEIFSRETLDKMWKNAELPSEREHVTQFIFNNNEFRIGNVKNDVDLSDMRWTLDEKEDLEEHWKKCYNLMNEDQKKIFEEIKNKLENNQQILMMIDAPAGTGKTWLMSAVSSLVRSQQSICLNAAFSGVAAQLLEGGKTIHTQFKMGINLPPEVQCSIAKGTTKAKILEQSVLFKRLSI